MTQATITKHIGDLIITAANASSFQHLEEVTGSLYIRADAQLPVLTSVGGYLDISADGFKVESLPALKSAHGVEGRLVAVKKWGLWYSTDYKFYAGCQGPLTKRQAIALSKKWDDQEVAQYFAKVIEAIDEPVEMVE